MALPTETRKEELSADGLGTLGSRWHELTELDRLLGLLARPALELERSTQRKELIERVWTRKRPLLRQLGAFDEPLPPCA
ncbi:MAG TPA: hypothetical protein VGV88_13405 [Candidatus Dormibacteraeota bacterium]|nr:hypothetical protein [Candidatus Dormibacteraeota bacterium]